MTDSIKIHQVSILRICQLVKKQMSDLVALLLQHRTLSLSAQLSCPIICFEMNKIWHATSSVSWAILQTRLKEMAIKLSLPIEFGKILPQAANKLTRCITWTDHPIQECIVYFTGLRKYMGECVIQTLTVTRI